TRRRPPAGERPSARDAIAGPRELPSRGPPAPKRVGSLRKVPRGETCFDTRTERLSATRDPRTTRVSPQLAAQRFYPSGASASAAAARDVASRARLRALASWPA